MGIIINPKYESNPSNNYRNMALDKQKIAFAVLGSL